tara:strand:- start:513 stop:1112 length:600 start_codon:yes stop_codon:yes gene_type:complete
MRAKEAYSDEYNMYRTARKYGNLHILNKEQTMSEISMTTGEFEAGFCHLETEDKFGGYTIQMLFKSDSDAVKDLISAIEEADLANGAGHLPIQIDGDVTMIKAKSKFNVKVFNTQPKLISASEVQKSDICKARVKIQPYDNRGNKGVSVLLNGVQKIANGESRGDGDQGEEWFPPVDGSSAKKESGGSGQSEGDDFWAG